MCNPSRRVTIHVLFVTDHELPHSLKFGIIRGMGRKQSFTVEQHAEIAGLYTDGLSIARIAKRVGAQDGGNHYGAVRASLLRSGVKLRPRKSPFPESEWVICACGSRALYINGLCHVCYDRERNKTPEVQERRFNWWLLSYNGLTRDAYDALLESQGGVCAVCQGLNPHGARLAVDHDHACCPGAKSCGKCVRGLLCVRCNRATGLLKDSAENAGRLFAYLTR